MLIDVQIWSQPAPTHPGGVHIQEGDIVEARLGGTGIGKKEGRLFLWLCMDVPDSRWEVWPEPVLDADENVIEMMTFTFDTFDLIEGG